MSGPQLVRTAALLAEVFPGARISDEGYLRWLYEESPCGPVIETNLADDHGPTAHYAVVPIPLLIAGEPVAGALSLNTAVHERARGGGVFVKLATDTFTAAVERGVQIVVGVANANSTPGFERRLGFTNHGPLPATVLIPRPGRAAGVRSGWSEASPALLEDIEPLLAADTTGLVRTWTPETLRWRLRSPGSRYAVHRSDCGLMVTTRERRAGVSVAVVLALFAPTAVGRRDLHALVRAACRFHRAPIALHVGSNERASFHGPPLPARLRTSPLNFISRGLDGRAVPAPARFEFLDFDAY